MIQKLILSLAVILIIIGAFVLRPSSPKQRSSLLPPPYVPSFTAHKSEYIKIMETDPKWYLNPQIKVFIDAYFRQSKVTMPVTFYQDKKDFIMTVGKLIEKGELKTGPPLTNLYKPRKPIDMIVIHHTETSPTADRAYIEGIQVFTLYILPVFADPHSEEYGQAIYSGHFDENGNPTFIGYHYIIWPDGHYQHILEDNQVGYHAKTNNAESIGIAFMGDYTKTRPTESAIATARSLIQQYPDARIVGHREVVSGTECPGDTFFGDNGWKRELELM